MRQSDHEYEERSFGDIQRAIDFENSMNDLESQLYYRRLSPSCPAGAESHLSILRCGLVRSNSGRSGFEPVDTFLVVQHGCNGQNDAFDRRI